MKLKFVPLALTLAAVFAVGAPTLHAQDEAAPVEKKAALKGEKKDKKTPPFMGTISATNAEAMTVTLTGKEKERVITLNAETKITKDGADATFADLKAGETIRGQVMKDADGKEIATKVMIGAKPAGEKKPKKEKNAEEATEEKAAE